MEKGLIIGKGWLGSRIEKYLSNNYEFVTTKREADKSNCISINFDSLVEDKINLNDFLFIIITIPFGKRQAIEVLENRFNNLKNYLKGFKNQVFLISSTGIYPESDLLVDEDTYTNASLNENYIRIEQLIKKELPQTVILRLGGLMGDDRYMSRYLTLNRPDLDNVTNHTHYIDVCRGIEKMIEKKVTHSLYNLVAPEHPTKEEVLEYQINQKDVESTTKKGKRISSQKLIEELDFEFTFDNPKFFK